MFLACFLLTYLLTYTKLSLAAHDDPLPAPSQDPALPVNVANADGVAVNASATEHRGRAATEDDDGGAIPGPKVEAHVNLAKTYRKQPSLLQPTK